MNAGTRGRGTGGNIECRHPFAARAPQDAVLDFVPAAIHRDVGHAKTDKDDDDGDGEGRSSAAEPAQPRRRGCRRGREIRRSARFARFAHRDTSTSVEVAKLIP